MSLLGPRLIYILFLSFFLGLSRQFMHHTDIILDGLSWFGSITLGEIFDYLFLMPGILLWLLLIVASLFRTSILHKVDNFLPAVSKPKRHIRRHHTQQYNKAKTKFYRTQTQRLCPSGNCVPPSNSFARDFARSFQGGPTTQFNHCKPPAHSNNGHGHCNGNGNARRRRYRGSNRRARFNRSQARSRSRSRSRPHNLDLSHRLFRGIGSRHSPSPFSGAPHDSRSIHVPLSRNPSISVPYQVPDSIPVPVPTSVPDVPSVPVPVSVTAAPIPLSVPESVPDPVTSVPVHQPVPDIHSVDFNDLSTMIPYASNGNRLLIKVLRTVATSLRKPNPNTWVQSLQFKLRSIGITTASALHESLRDIGYRDNKTINTKLYYSGHRLLNRSTLQSLKLEVSIALEAASASTRTSTDSTFAWFGESVILQHPAACRAAMRNDDTFTVVWDSGASMCVSFDRRDFIGNMQQLPKGSSIQGITNHLKIEGSGSVIWSIMGTTGRLRHLKLPCYYIPKLKQRLLSTSVFTKTYPQNPITVTGASWSISPNPSNPEEGGIDVFINPRNNLPCSTCFRHDGIREAAALYTEAVSTVHITNCNLSEPAKELLRWHFRLAHVGLRTIQFIMETGVLSSSESM